MYLMDHKSGKTSVIVRLNKDVSIDKTFSDLPYISSVSFDRSGEAISVGTSDRQIHIYDVEK